MDTRDQEDELLKSLFRESASRSESGITEHVMKHIDQSSEVFEYKPVIGKKAWGLIVCGFLGLMLFALFYSGNLVLIETPELLSILSSGFTKLQLSFSLDLGNIRIPKPPATILLSIVAFNVIGVFLIVSYKWNGWMFRR